jgi:hypothetical protein
MKVTELKAELKRRGLDVRGLKANLQKCLQKALAVVDNDGGNDGAEKNKEEAPEEEKAAEEEAKNDKHDGGAADKAKTKDNGKDEAPKPQDHSTSTCSFKLGYLHLLSPEELAAYCHQEVLYVTESNPQL